MKLLVSVIMGLGEWANGPLLGMRKTLEQDAFKNADGNLTYTLLTAEHNGESQKQTIRDAIEDHQKVMLIGHSLGGHEVYKMASECGLPIDVVVMLDAVDPDSGGIKGKTKPYPLLLNVRLMVAFTADDAWPSGAGLDLDPGSTRLDAINIPMHDCGHSELPGREEVLEFIAGKVLELR